MSEDPQTETTLNIPSILVFTILASLLVRYLFFSSPASNAASGASGELGCERATGMRLSTAMIDKLFRHRSADTAGQDRHRSDNVSTT